ncbi:hypothetical protein CCP2SC5_160050 [Azospirillaceae bacterium]
MNEMDVAAVKGLPQVLSVRVSAPVAPNLSDGVGVDKLVGDRQMAEKVAVDRLRADKGGMKSGDENSSAEQRMGDGRKQDPSVVLSASTAGLLSRRAVAELLNKPAASVAASDVMRASIASAKAFGDEMSRALVTMGHDLNQLVRVMGVSDIQADQIVRGFIGRFSEDERDRKQPIQNIGRYQSSDGAASVATDASAALTLEVRNIEITVSDASHKVSVSFDNASLSVTTEQTSTVAPSSAPSDPWERKRSFFDAEGQRVELGAESRGLYAETDNVSVESRKALRELLMKTLGKAMLQDDADRAARLQETMQGVALVRSEGETRGRFELPSSAGEFPPLKPSEREKSGESGDQSRFSLDMAVPILHEVGPAPGVTVSTVDIKA